jgi:hypothetical protein
MTVANITASVTTALALLCATQAQQGNVTIASAHLHSCRIDAELALGSHTSSAWLGLGHGRGVGLLLSGDPGQLTLSPAWEAWEPADVMHTMIPNSLLLAAA